MPCEWCQPTLVCSAGGAPYTLSGLEEEIASVDIMMERLAQRRTVLRRKINSLSPTSLLPTEILIEIFRLASQSTEANATPLFLGSICKGWRDIAWSTPLLWNTVSLHLTRTMHEARVDILREWLTRARESRLYIKITADDEDEGVFCSLHYIMDALLERSMYWYSVDCLLPFQCHAVLKGHHFPMLRSVSVHPPKGTISTFNEPPNMFLSAPKLLDVDLSGYNFPAMVLPWEQLRRFKTQFLTVAECLKVLRQSPNLKECHLESVYCTDILPPPVSEIMTFNLESLEVALIKGAAVSLLHSISLPSLRELRVTYSGAGSPLISAIRALIGRSGCIIERLSIEKHNIQDDALISLLEATPSLTHLRLSSLSDGTHPSMGLTETLVSALDPSRQTPPLLPTLMSVEYRGRVLSDVHSILALVMNRSRLAGVIAGITPLLTVDVVSSVQYNVPPDAQELICQLRGTGMSVFIGSGEGKQLSQPHGLHHRG